MGFVTFRGVRLKKRLIPSDSIGAIGYKGSARLILTSALIEREFIVGCAHFVRRGYPYIGCELH